MASISSSSSLKPQTLTHTHNQISQVSTYINHMFENILWVNTVNTMGKNTSFQMEHTHTQIHIKAVRFFFQSMIDRCFEVYFKSRSRTQQKWWMNEWMTTIVHVFIIITHLNQKKKNCCRWSKHFTTLPLSEYITRDKEKWKSIPLASFRDTWQTGKKILIIIFPTWNIFSPSHVNSNNSSNYPIIQSPMRINLNQLFSSSLLLYGTYCCYEFHFIVNH